MGHLPRAIGARGAPVLNAVSGSLRKMQWDVFLVLAQLVVKNRLPDFGIAT